MFANKKFRFIVTADGWQPTDQELADIKARFESALILPDGEVTTHFTKSEFLTEEFEQWMCQQAAKLLNTSVDKVMAGNSHNSMEIANLFHTAYPSALSSKELDLDGCSVQMTLHVWNGHAYVLCDDLIGVFCTREAAVAVLSHQWPKIDDGMFDVPEDPKRIQPTITVHHAKEEPVQARAPLCGVCQSSGYCTMGICGGNSDD